MPLALNAGATLIDVTWCAEAPDTSVSANKMKEIATRAQQTHDVSRRMR